MPLWLQSICWKLVGLQSSQWAKQCRRSTWPGKATEQTWEAERDGGKNDLARLIVLKEFNDATAADSNINSSDGIPTHENHCIFVVFV